MTTLVSHITSTIQQHGRATLDDIMTSVPPERRGSVKATVAKLVKGGQLRRVAKGVYEVVAPLAPKVQHLYEETERLFNDLSVLERALLKRGPERFPLREHAKQEVPKLLKELQLARSLAQAQSSEVQTHVTITSELLAVRAREVLTTIEKLEKADPKPEPLRGGRGRPAKYSK
jgi:hypothetical protein